MNAPVNYMSGFLRPWTSDEILESLWNGLRWVRHDKVPRREYFVNRNGGLYTYGTGAGVRTYASQPSIPVLDLLWEYVEAIERTKYDMVFLNGYENQRDHLGWHADDSPEMDMARPISIVSLGAEREIWFREKPSDTPIVMANGSTIRLVNAHERLLLQHGSLCTMAPGMQNTHQHRIPKADRTVGHRVSLTFRGLAP